MKNAFKHPRDTDAAYAAFLVKSSKSLSPLEVKLNIMYAPYAAFIVKNREEKKNVSIK
ncbi:MAG: hypothetical protein SAJ37_23375 [Oscillatoria sp. PMC 1068.18]|nr:hypothetical protein [Oscillatoria sp. PMC 1076.18]MEC4991687.1 hypothetical protein [Oscillatoria sp. PMC 1068.18]